MVRSGFAAALFGASTLVGIVPAGATTGADAPEPSPDPEVVAQREAQATLVLAPGDAAPPLVQRDQAAPSTSSRLVDLRYLDAQNTADGYVRVFARDNPIQDDPGYLTTTMRIYGNAAAFRDGSGEVSLKSQFTCSGAGISGLSIGATSATVSGNVASSTLTWTSSRSSSTEVRQSYAEGGHFRCKASNATAAKTTRRGIATAQYKQVDTRAQDEYSFWW
jgi:hypothetical protein